MASSIGKLGPIGWHYHYDLAAGCRAEYYLGRGEVPGTWLGDPDTLAGYGLTAGTQVAEPELAALLERGVHPRTGAQLGRAIRPDGVAAFDVTFSAPKSVSAALVDLDPAQADRCRTL